jgi:hypothetical protein
MFLAREWPVGEKVVVHFFRHLPFQRVAFWLKVRRRYREPFLGLEKELR